MQTLIIELIYAQCTQTLMIELVYAQCFADINNRAYFCTVFADVNNIAYFCTVFADMSRTSCCRHNTLNKNTPSDGNNGVPIQNRSHVKDFKLQASHLEQKHSHRSNG